MLLKLDFKSDEPIYEQITRQVILAIAAGQLNCGEKLPTIRELAVECGINMMTVSKAYQQLKAEGYIETDRRNGASVTAHLPVINSFDEKNIRQLTLLAARAKLSGMDAEAFAKLCADAYQEDET